jgi:hypothetical protein
MALRGAATSRPRFWGRTVVSDREHTDAQPLPSSVSQGDLLPEGGLIELGAGAELTVQATVSTREITLVGPGLAEVCPSGEEAVRLSRGKVTAFPGAGVRPGAEVWVATALGVIRFNDANIEIAVLGHDADRIEVALATGHATFVPAGGMAEAGSGEEEVALVQGVRFAASRPSGPLARWVRDLVAACVRLGGAAREAGRLIVASSDGSRASLGDLAFAHVRARQRARAACEMAWAAGAVGPGLLDATSRADLEGQGDRGLP